jgi:hypothetical protein
MIYGGNTWSPRLLKILSDGYAHSLLRVLIEVEMSVPSEYAFRHCPRHRASKLPLEQAIRCGRHAIVMGVINRLRRRGVVEVSGVGDERQIRLLKPKLKEQPVLPTVKIGDRTFTFLFPDLIPPLSDDELMRLRESIRLNGVIARVVVDESDGVIDGINRLRVAEEIGLTTVPVEVQAGLTHEKKVELAYSLNEDRRQLDAAAMKKLRQQRVARVAEARREGKSTREIAEQEQVSQTQVIRDLEEAKSTEPGGSVDPPGGKVKGKDGKKRTARRPQTSAAAAKAAPPSDPVPAPDHVVDRGDEPATIGTPPEDNKAASVPPATEPPVSYDPDDPEFFNRPELADLHKRPVADIEALLLRVIREYGHRMAREEQARAQARAQGQKRKRGDHDPFGVGHVWEDVKYVTEMLAETYAAEQE